MRWAGDGARMGDRKGTYTVSVGKPKGRKPLGRWEDEIQTSLQEVGWGVMDWIDLAQDWGQVADGCECSYESSGSIKCWQFLY